MNVGIDIVKIARFKNIKNNNTLMCKIFCMEEIQYLQKRNYDISTMAGMYSAKEAFLKAIKKGLNDYPLNDIEISHDNNGAPFLILHNKLIKLNIEDISISISHDGDYAVSILFLKLS